MSEAVPDGKAHNLGPDPHLEPLLLSTEKESAEVVWAPGQDASLRRFSGLIHLGGDLGEGPGPGGEIISPLWPGSTRGA